MPHVTPVLVDCNFTVDPANGNGLGIHGLKGQGVSNVFMHTSATPGAGPNGVLNPNPAAGIITVQLTDNFSRYYGGFSGFSPPVSGTPIVVTAAGAALTPGVVYIITSLGTTTAADWTTLGVPIGVIPAVGVSFVALVTGAGVGSGAVEIPAAAYANAVDIELIGDPNLMLSPVPIGGSPHVGGWLNFATITVVGGATVQSTLTTGTVVGMAFYLSQSSVKVDGE